MASGTYQVTVLIIDKFTAQINAFNTKLQAINKQHSQIVAPFTNVFKSLQQSAALISKGLGLDKIASVMGSILKTALSIGKVFASFVGISALLSFGGLLAGLRAFGEQGLDLTNMQNRTGMNAASVNTLDTASYLAGGRKGALAEGMEQSGQLAYAAQWGNPAGYNAQLLRTLYKEPSADPSGRALTGEQLLPGDRRMVQAANTKNGPRAAEHMAKELGYGKDALPLLLADNATYTKMIAEAKKNALSPKDIENAKELELGIRRLTNSFTGLANTLFKAFSPTVMRLMTDFQSWLDGMGLNGQKNVDMLAQGFNKFGDTIERIDWKTIRQDIVDFAKSFEWLLTPLKFVIDNFTTFVKIWVAFKAIQAASFVLDIARSLGLLGAASTLAGSAFGIAARGMLVSLAALAAPFTAFLATLTAIAATIGLIKLGSDAEKDPKTKEARDKLDKERRSTTGGPNGQTFDGFDAEGRPIPVPDTTSDGKTVSKTGDNISTMTIHPGENKPGTEIENPTNNNDAITRLNEQIAKLEAEIKQNSTATIANTEATKPKSNTSTPSNGIPVPGGINSRGEKVQDLNKTPRGLPPNIHPPAYKQVYGLNTPEDQQQHVERDWPGALPPDHAGNAYRQRMAPGATVPRPDVPQAPPSGNFIPGDQNSFIQNFSAKAAEVGARTGVDPKIILAQAGLESGWGKHAPNNNFFGIKGPGGVQNTKEFINGKMVNTQASFAGYQSPDASFDAYGDFLLKNPRYTGMRNAKGIDAQINALGSSGYATDPAYKDKIRNIVTAMPALPATSKPFELAAKSSASSDVNNVVPFINTYTKEHLMQPLAYPGASDASDPAQAKPNQFTFPTPPELKPAQASDPAQAKPNQFTFPTPPELKPAQASDITRVNPSQSFVPTEPQAAPNNLIQFPMPMNDPMTLQQPQGPVINLDRPQEKKQDEVPNDQISATEVNKDGPTGGHITVSIDHKNVPPGVKLTANAKGNAFRGPVNVNTRNLPGTNSYYG